MTGGVWMSECVVECVYVVQCVYECRHGCVDECVWCISTVSGADGGVGVCFVP